MQNTIPVQHASWVTAHTPPLPLVVTPPQFYDIFTIPLEIPVDFRTLGTLPNETKAKLQQLRGSIATQLSKSNWATLPLSTLQENIREYLKLLPASTGQYLKLPWTHLIKNTSAEFERVYMTFNLGYSLLIDTSSSRKDKLKMAIGCFKNMLSWSESLGLSKQLCILAENMSRMAWLLYIHLEVEERIQGKVLDSKAQAQVITTIYTSLASEWDTIDTVNLDSRWMLLGYYCKSMVIFCKALAEYFACQCVILDPNGGIQLFYPDFLSNVNMYRGLLLSRLNGHVVIFGDKIVKPDVLDKLSDKISKQENVLIQIYKIRSTLLDSCFRPLLAKITEYNTMTSHDPIPEFVPAQFKGNAKPLPVTPFNQFLAFEYLVPPKVDTLATVATAAPEASLLSSVMQKITEKFSPNMGETNTLIQSELENINIIFNADPEWIQLKMDLVDAIKFRMQNIVKIPPQQLPFCVEYDRNLLYLLHHCTQLPRTFFGFISATIRTETLSYYEKL